ncbi:sugar dehydrogenase complex small subunit [Curvibacter sp. HBC61]|uniref:Sugar dehydrogenase complex small subunit n=1 Tax=Curvibacter cyanobacteriorum TaxID=3026422 RepID=A0ABT5MWX9_9BURK|nr:sugar dehydrogenase complex small subunit [Curvibacter sp. HBC61]MDD0837956.1 sugar dehydrogenase complex small subunit [Curvibacter sp. HBC61]
MQTHDLPARRRLMVQLAACAAAVALPSGVVQAASSLTFPRRQVRALASVCQTLTGIASDNDTLTQQYLSVLLKNLDKAQWNALMGLAKMPPPQQRAASLQAPLSEVVEFALQLWVSGMAGQTQVVTYAEAPIWSALTFTKPPGMCGGAFGYWAERPAA